MSHAIRIDGLTLTLEDIERVATQPTTVVELAPEARSRMKASRDFIEAKVAAGEPVYGVTT